MRDEEWVTSQDAAGLERGDGKQRRRQVEREDGRWKREGVKRALNFLG